MDSLDSMNAVSESGDALQVAVREVLRATFAPLEAGLAKITVLLQEQQARLAPDVPGRRSSSPRYYVSTIQAVAP
jgi:hypothetical protein